MKRVFAIGALVCALTGCGTVWNFTEGYKGETKPYGGVKIAATNFSDDLVAVAMMWPVYAADVASSAVADTVTLPVTLSLVAWRQATGWYELLFHYNEPPDQQKWREFWYGDQPQPQKPAPERVHGGIY